MKFLSSITLAATLAFGVLSAGTVKADPGVVVLASVTTNGTALAFQINTGLTNSYPFSFAYQDLVLTGAASRSTNGPGLQFSLIGTNATNTANAIYSFATSVDGTNFDTGTVATALFNVTVPFTGNTNRVFITNFPSGFCLGKRAVRMVSLGLANTNDGLYGSVTVCQPNDLR